MSDSMTNRALSMPVHSMDGDGRAAAQALERVHPTPAKATLPPATSMATVVKEALLESHEKLDCAAREMGMDPSQLSRDLQTGNLHLKKLDALDDAAKATVADRLHERWGVCDPKELIRREIRDARTRLNRIEELIARER